MKSLYYCKFLLLSVVPLVKSDAMIFHDEVEKMSKEVENVRMLRRRFVEHIDEMTGSISTLEPMSEIRTEGDVTRVIVNCNKGESAMACKNRILDSVSEGCLRFIHYLRDANAYAVEIKISNLNELDDMEEDPIRETMHLPESLQIHSGRSLQSGNQAIPFGIDLVRAREAWERFDTKGENVRVCGKFLQFRDVSLPMMVVVSKLIESFAVFPISHGHRCIERPRRPRSIVWSRK